MNKKDVVKAWGRILMGYQPLLSIELTRECPLHCPGCYAYEPNHLGGDIGLRQLQDFRGEELIRRVLEVVDRYKPLHLSIVGGDPLVRYRELERLVPLLIDRGVYVQVVTSAFRPIPVRWAKMENLKVVVSVDGLQAEHDERRKPATYQRILQNIAGTRITIHCTLTGKMLHRDGYIGDFARFWSARDEVQQIWFSIFTPQRGEVLPEILSAQQRRAAIEELLRLVTSYPKIDMTQGTLRAFLQPPQSPAECVFAQVTRTISSDLKTQIKPCQFGGDPDCSQCGCLASMAMASVGRKKAAGRVSLDELLRASSRVGATVAKAAGRN